MSKAIFRFKQFEIVQEKSAMKIGTDGVLLGSWADATSCKTILDIGSGTGLISLMMAQRFPESEITGIEIEKDAAEEAIFNFHKSPFRDRLNCQNISLQQYKNVSKFDFIISNPPFFDLTHKNNSSRNKARQQLNLTFEELIFHTNRLLTQTGKAAFIIPYDKENELVQIAENFSLFPEKISRIKGNENSQIKRSMVQFCKTRLDFKLDELILEISRNQYTEAYKNLTKEFYLKL